MIFKPSDYYRGNGMLDQELTVARDSIEQIKKLLESVNTKLQFIKLAIVAQPAEEPAQDSTEETIVQHSTAAQQAVVKRFDAILTEQLEAHKLTASNVRHEFYSGGDAVRVGFVLGVKDKVFSEWIFSIQDSDYQIANWVRARVIKFICQYPDEQKKSIDDASTTDWDALRNMEKISQALGGAVQMIATERLMREREVKHALNTLDKDVIDYAVQALGGSPEQITYETATPNQRRFTDRVIDVLEENCLGFKLRTYSVDFNYDSQDVVRVTLRFGDSDKFIVMQDHSVLTPLSMLITWIRYHIQLYLDACR